MRIVQVMQDLRNHRFVISKEGDPNLNTKKVFSYLHTIYCHLSAVYVREWMSEWVSERVSH